MRIKFVAILAILLVVVNGLVFLQNHSSIQDQDLLLYKLPALGEVHPHEDELRGLVTEAQINRSLRNAGWDVVPVPMAKQDKKATFSHAIAWLLKQESHDVEEGLCDDEVACLAIALWWENRSSRAAMCDVAWVILNRVNNRDFPLTIKKVVTQTEPVLQFAFVRDGLSDRPRIENYLERVAWVNAWEISASALAGKGECAKSAVADAVYFQSHEGAQHDWWKKLDVVADRYGHTFFVPRS